MGMFHCNVRNYQRVGNIFHISTMTFLQVFPAKLPFELPPCSQTYPAKQCVSAQISGISLGVIEKNMKNQSNWKGNLSVFQIRKFWGGVFHFLLFA